MAMDRRIFLNRVARGGLLSLLVLVTGILVSRKQVSLKASCTGDFQCRNCNKLNGCELPEAISERDYGEKG